MTRSNLLTAISSADGSIPVPGTGAGFPALSAVTLFCICLMSLALAALFGVNLTRLWQATNPVSGDPAWGHAIYLPFVSLAYLQMRKKQIVRLRPRPARCGLLVLLGGMGLFAYGICMASVFPALSSFVQDLGMIITMLAVVITIFGWTIGKFALFPIGYLLCGIPWPPTLIDITTAPLQHLAATASIWILGFSPLNVAQVGNTIHVLAMTGPDRVLEVAEACSGLRSIAVFIAIGLAVAFLPARAVWKSVIISLCAVPIAIACNVMRIVGDVLLDHYVSHALSEGFYHSFTGVVLLVPGVFLFLLVGRALDWAVPMQDVSKPVLRDPEGPDLSPSDPALRGTSEPARGVRRAYITVLCIVMIAAVTFGITSQVLQLHFQKSPVPLQYPLGELPVDIGSWRQVGTDRPLDADVQAMLGSNQYLFRTYFDTRVIKPRAIDDEKSAMEISAEQSAASVQLSVTYYTGRVDSVSHIPERCYVGGGEASSTQSVQRHWIVAGRPMDVRLVAIDAPKAAAGAIRYVAYCYRVNGRDESESWRVRRSLINVFERYAWYAKIEAATSVADPNEASRVLNNFLNAALPVIESRLPGGDSIPLQKQPAFR